MSWKEEFESMDDGCGGCLKNFASELMSLFKDVVHSWNKDDQDGVSKDEAERLAEEAIEKAWNKAATNH